MASSIHIEKVTSGSFLHNDRTMKVSYLIDDSSLNECTTSSSEVIEQFNRYKSEAIKNYTNRTNQKIQKSTIFLKEAIVNLEEHHTLKDLQPIKEKLESYGFKVLQMSIHRDEGFVNSEDKKKKNYHAHITMFNLDLYSGKTVKFGKHYKSELSKLQTFTADTLKMERGTISVKQEAERLNTKVSKPKKRLGTHEYKQAMKIKEKEIEELTYNFRDYQKQITALQDTSTEDKKELHKLNSEVKNIKNDIETKNFKIEELEQRLTAYKSSEMPRHLKSFTPQNINLKLSEVNLKDGVFGSRKVKVLSEIEAIKLHQNYRDLKEVYSKVYEFASEQKIEIVKTEVEVEKEVIVEKIVYKDEPINLELKEQNRSLIADITNLIDENTKIKKEFDEYKNDIEIKANFNEKKSKFLRERSRSSTKLIIAQEKEITAYKRDIERLENQAPVKIENPINQQLKKEVEELKTLVYHPEIRHSDGTKATFEETTEHYKQKLESTEELLDNSYDDNNKHLHNLKLAREEIKQQKATIDTLEAEIRGYKQSIEQLEAEIKQLKRDLRTYRGTDRQTKRAELNQMEQEDKQLHQQLDQAKGLTASLSHLISKSDRQILEDMIEKDKKEEEKPKSDPTPRPYSPPFRM